MSKQERKNMNDAANEVEPRDFHVWVRPRTAAWLRKRRTKDSPTVPAVIREIVEEAMLAESKQPATLAESG
jgi:hypothetical protein